MRMYDVLFAKKMSGGGVSPTGIINITENGDYDVTQYANAAVAVPQGVFPTGTISITQNATGIDVTNYASADVNVNTDPEKGVVFDEWDEDGYPTRARIIGFTTAPANAVKPGINGSVVFTTINTIIIGEGTNTISSYFAYGNTAITTVTFPTTVTQINGYAFENTGNLKYVHIPNNSTVTIVAYSFRGSGVEELELDGNVYMGQYVMFGSLKKFICHGQITLWGTNCVMSNNVELYDFSGCDSVFTLSSTANLRHVDGCVIKVKQSLLSTWQASTNWCDLPTDPNTSGYVVWEGV